MHLLIAEDDPRSAEFLTKGLTESGFTVDAAKDGETAWQRIREGSYDLIVLDVMMPAMDGWGVLAKLRATGLSTPVLFLTARDTVADRVKGLDLGADDSLVKPHPVAAQRGAWAGSPPRGGSGTGSRPHEGPPRRPANRADRQGVSYAHAVSQAPG